MIKRIERIKNLYDYPQAYHQMLISTRITRIIANIADRKDIARSTFGATKHTNLQLGEANPSG